MNPTPWEWRRAERLNQLLDLAHGRRIHHRRRRSELDTELSPLVTTAKRVEALPIAITGDPSFRASLRAHLVQEAALLAHESRTGAQEERAATPQAPVRLGSRVSTSRTVAPRQRAHPRRTRAAILAGVTAGALVLSGVSAASNGAMPGDVLYQVKRSAERAQLALAGSDLSRGQLYLEFAGIRMNEARTTLDLGLVPGVLNDFDTEAAQGAALLTGAATDHHSAVALDKIDAFVREEVAQLALLKGRAGVDAARVKQSLDAILALGDSSRQTRAGLS